MRQPDRPASSLPNTAATTTSSTSRRGDNGQELPEEGQGARDYRHSSAAEPSSSSPAPQDSSISRWSRGESSSAPRRLSAAAMVESGGAAAFLPESVVEAVAVEAAAAAARAHGAMAASRTLACIFQVCSVWRSVSQSELLWENAFNVVWPTQARQPERSWRREFQRAHTTASNFRRGRARHTILVEEETGGRHYEPPRSLAISNDYLVGGHFDGALRVFDLKTKACVWTLRANQEEGFGPLSRAIAGISLQGDDIVFGSVDGNVFTASASRGNRVRVHVGRVIQDGALISFAASQRWWIALYAGSVGHCFRLWDAATKQVVYRGGNMTDDDAMRGWHMLVERAGRVGRVRIVNEELLVAANRRRIRVHDLGTHGMPLIVERDQEAENNAVEAMDVRGNKLLSASYEGLARIRELPTMVEVLTVRHAGVHANPRLRPDDREQMQQLFGTLNSRQLFLCFSGAVNAWDCSSGEHLYSLREETGYMYNDMVASDSCLAVSSRDTGLHLWDFSPDQGD
ncbi:transcriptional regulator STERILE APETALA [Selaginella moellendorffii]|uniref:transcriptional regulator STERILE APETALA n=1 Tax=Selaginella moellendorffii TaxID=88036 RepID=UPI000D1CDB3D|nr:transcriptional regulator STERILE APETALA [Selaginella moellendorffii]|eukprot:XP_024539571.1 transcriptional regulator STERILE APETALA [Selaginella moellendorffii]